MATSASELSISDLADILAALTEVTNPYQLGIQLKVDLAELDTIEKNYSGNIGRQKTEVIKYWLRNSQDASWTTLANAVERMGGHTRLAEKLRKNKNKNEEEIQTTFASRAEGDEEGLREDDEEMSEEPVLPSPSGTPPDEPVSFRRRRRTNSFELKFEQLVYNVLLLGKMGHGKSTLGNRMLNLDGCFSINDQKCPQTTEGSAVLQSASQLKDYTVKVYDHNGLFEGASSIDTLASNVSSKLHLVIFVLKQGCRCDESVVKRIIEKWRINEMSALVLTHCERLSTEERKKVIKQFVSDHPSIAVLMGKGILAVGFPDSSYMKNEPELSERVEDDKAKLRQLLYSSDVPVFMPENSRQLCCSIL